MRLATTVDDREPVVVVTSTTQQNMGRPRSKPCSVKDMTEPGTIRVQERYLAKLPVSVQWSSELTQQASRASKYRQLYHGQGADHDPRPAEKLRNATYSSVERRPAPRVAPVFNPQEDIGGRRRSKGRRKPGCATTQEPLFEKGLHCTHARVRNSCLSCLHCVTTNDT